MNNGEGGSGGVYLMGDWFGEMGNRRMDIVGVGEMRIFVVK